MARLIFSINNNTAVPFTNKWPGWNSRYVETTTVSKNVILGDGTETTINFDKINSGFFTENPLYSSCLHIGDINDKSYFTVRDSSFVTWTTAEKTEYGYAEESLPLSEAETNLIILKPGEESSNTEIYTEAADQICERFMDPLTANTVQAQADAEAFGYNFANTYTFNV